MLKNIGLCLCPRSHRLFSQENNKIAKHQRQKIQGITFTWKSVAFILKENKKMAKCQRPKNTREKPSLKCKVKND
jgi:hypothetical protein